MTTYRVTTNDDRATDLLADKFHIDGNNNLLFFPAGSNYPTSAFPAGSWKSVRVALEIQ